MEFSDAYKPPKNEPDSVNKQRPGRSLTRRIFGWGLGLLAAGILVGMLLPPMGRGVRPAARRTVCMNNMRQISLAILNYESSNGHFPPAYIADENGKPMHSWRVLILPFLDENDLYGRYSMEEPWDGPNNRKLADEIIDVYTCPSHYSRDGKTGFTNYCLVTGEGTLFEQDRTLQFSDIKDGTSNTVLLVEVNHDDIHWLEPRDLTIDEAVGVFEVAAANNSKGSHHSGIQVVGFADGSTVSLETSSTRIELLNLFLIADETAQDNPKKNRE